MSRSFDYKIQADIVGNNATIGTINVNNISLSGTLSQSGITYISSQWTSTAGNAITYTSGNVITETLNASTMSGGNLSLSGDLIVGGSITTVNITSTNIVDTNITTGTLTSTNINSTNISVGSLINTNLINTNSSISNAIITNLTASSVQLSNVGATTLTVGTLLDTNAIITNLTASSAQISNMNLTTSTIGTAIVSAGNVNLGSGNLFSNVFSASNNTSIPTDITNFSFDSASVGCFSATVYVKMIRSAGGNLYSMYTIEGLYSSAGWYIYPSVTGDTTGIVFSITAGGQIQYTSTNQSNWTSTSIKYLVVQV